MNSEHPQVLLDERCYDPATGKLFGNGCRNCNNQFFPVRDFCPDCLSAETMERFEIPAKGTLYTYTVIHAGPASFGPPYTVGYADVSPQLRLFGRVQTIGGRTPKINEQVAIKLGKIGTEDGRELWGVVFEPAEQEVGK